MMPTRRAWLLLIPLLVFATWYRAHTFGPTLRDSVGINLWPACVGETEPLDCDEAIYAYIGHRMLAGDVMYRDLTENKPPLGYWLYALTVAIGGYNELAVRIMPLVPVLATLCLVGWIAAAIRGPGSAVLAGMLYILLSTDPYIFGNGANMEHFMNLFGAAALASFLHGWDRPGWSWLFWSGAFLGAEILVKQVAVTHGVLFAIAIVARHLGRTTESSPVPSRWKQIGRDWLAFGSGAAIVCGLAALVLIAQGAGPAAFEDIFRYGPALATDTLPEPNAPSAWVRWLTGNADPQGTLPWPFGSTDYLVWWGTGSWPLWLAGVLAMSALGLGRKSSPSRRIVAAWTASAILQIVLPGLYWPHYYLLPIPGLALVTAICAGDAVAGISASRRLRPAASAVGVAAIALAIPATTFLQVRDYLRVPPEELTIRYKGGRQWVVLRRMGRDLARRKAIWTDPRLFIWGWQSPLYFYGRLDSVTPHVFTDNLLRDQAGRNHPLIEPRTEAIALAIERDKPGLIFTGYPPFPALDAILRRDYLRSRIAPGLWVDQVHYGQFETFTTDR
jgi:4-amino-4-deoxy-L-arabinose transferase-like glycosyltransferase